MKYYKIILILLFVTGNIESQTIEKNNIVFAEGFGSGGYGSINYEYIIFRKGNLLKIGTRIGIGTYHFVDYTNRFNPDIILPVTINTFYGKEQITTAHNNNLFVTVWGIHSRRGNTDAVAKNPDLIQTDRVKHLTRLMK